MYVCVTSITRPEKCPYLAWGWRPSKMVHQLIKRFSSMAGTTLSVAVSDVYAKVKDFVLGGLYDQALELFFKDQLQNLHTHASTTTSVLPSVIKACSHYPQTHHSLGLQLHCTVLKSGSDLEPTVSNSLISMYAKFSDTECARKLFDTMPHRDTISWNSMINCYTRNGHCFRSLEMFKEMYVCGFVPKPELIAGVLSACGQTGDMRLGREIHALVVVVIDGRIEKSVFLSTALVDLYWRCHDSVMAFRVFDRIEVKNEVSWTAMISGCAAAATVHNYEMALDYFRAMLAEGIKPNRVTLITVLAAACAEIVGFTIKHGKEIHGYAFRHGFDSDICFSSALIHMYCKLGEAWHPAARLIFERSKQKDVVMWSSIIASYSQSGASAEESVTLFNRMQKEGFLPNSVTLLVVISACTNLLSISRGHQVHGYAFKSGMDSELSVGNSLINMYSKCGCLRDSHQIFKEMSMRDSVSWTTVINAYGLHGCTKEALQLFNEMQEGGLEHDAVTILALLCACNHTGFIEEGQRLFGKAMQDDRLSLTLEHYACYIDLLGRAGKLECACFVVSTMPMTPSMRIWSSLVSACKLHGRLEVAEMLVHRLIKSEPDNAANHTLLSLVYAESGNWLGVEGVRREMKIRGLRKSYGLSRIELEN